LLLRKKKRPEEPTLVRRLGASTARRIAIVGLHPGAGSRTVMQRLAAGAGAEGIAIGITRAPRAVPDQVETPPPIELPEGVVVATASPPAEREERLELLETTSCTTAAGPVALYRVTQPGPVSIHGPDAPDSIRGTLEHLERVTGGLALIDGDWQRRDFAAPGVTDGIVLTVGAGYSRSPEHSAAAIRYMIETLTVATCHGSSLAAWEEAASSNTAVVLDPEGRRLGSVPPETQDPVRFLQSLNGGGVGTVALPEGLQDGLLVPLVRSDLRCALVVRDPTRLLAAPVYLKAWVKGNGRLQVVRPARLLAVATNPVNPTGADADAQEFRRLVSEAADTLPVHDVVLESAASKRRSKRTPPTP
jgi:hypothetical protein